MNNMEYHGETVLASVHAKLISYDENIPDCMCNVYLTDGHIFVLEDNYDGTYTDHVILDKTSVRDVLIEDPYRKSFNDNDGHRTFNLLQILFSDNVAAQKAPKQKYFTIKYTDQKGSKETLYFDVRNHAAKKFVKLYKEHYSK